MPDIYVRFVCLDLLAGLLFVGLGSVYWVGYIGYRLGLPWCGLLLAGVCCRGGCYVLFARVGFSEFCFLKLFSESALLG